MAKKEVLALYKDDPSTGLGRAKAAQSGDTYLLPRLCYTTTGEFTSEVTVSGTAKAFQFDTGSNYRATSGAKMFVVENNGTEELSVTGESATSKTIVSANTTSANILEFRPQGSGSAGAVQFRAFAGLVTQQVIPDTTYGFGFISSVDDSGGPKTAMSFSNATALTDTGSYIVNFTQNSIGCYFTKDGGMEADHGLGLHGNAAQAQHTSTGNTAIGAAGSTNTVFRNTTFTGGTGTKAYTIGDVVRCLKNIGAMAAS